MPVLKIWSANQVIKKAVQVSEITVEKLIEKANEKGITGSKIYLLDGTEIDDDDILVEFQSETLIIGDRWVSDQKDIESHTATVSTVTAPNSPSTSISCSETSVNSIVFEIPFDKFPSSLLTKLNDCVPVSNTEVNTIVRIVTDELVQESKATSRSIYRVVARDLCDKYPQLYDRDADTKELIGTGYYTIFKRIEERVHYLQRPNSTGSRKKSSIKNLSAGCKEWQPSAPDNADLQTLDSKRDWLKSSSSIKEREEPRVELYMQETYAQQRTFLNSTPAITLILDEWPILLEEKYMILHFDRLCGINSGQCMDAFQKKSTEFHERLKTLLKNKKDCAFNESNLKENLQMVATYFNEDITDIYQTHEEPLTRAEITELPKVAAPSIVKSDNENIHYLLIEKTIVSETAGLSTSFQLLMAAYFNFNLEYPSECQNTLEFIQRTSNTDRNESPEAEGSISPEPPDRPPGKARQVHPEEKTQVLAYDSTYRKKPKALPLEEKVYYNHLANSNVAMSPMYPLTPNICVEGGKIEFIKSPPESARSSVALVSPPQTPVARRGSRDKRDVRIYDEPSEKFDGDKEVLERRIKQLESQLEEEKSRTQRERMTITKLQNKLIKREGAARSDAERERRARSDWEARARAAEADAARLAGKLHAAQREICRMEETVRSLLQYKGRVETLKQEKASLSSALEASAAHYQSQVSALTAENERLCAQLSARAGGDERRLDDVAQQVVRALLSQKSVREELGCARARVRELEAQNRALSALLVRQLRPAPRPSPATPHTPHTPHTPRDLQVHLVDVGSCGSLVSFRDSPPPPAPLALSHDDKRRHQILADIWTELKGMEVTPANLARALSAVDPTLWAAPPRPATLSLNVPQPCSNLVRDTGDDKVTEEENGETGEAGAESPESGAKDEGYSTMSSDVQADASRQSDHAADRALPDLNEASDETDNQTIVSINPRESRRHARLLGNDADFVYFPIGVAFAGFRGSYPPSRPVLPFQHVVRSFSDSHLCLKLLAGTTCPTSCLDSSTTSSGMLVLDLNPRPERPLRRTAIVSTTSSERVSWGSTVDERADGSQYDADYVQHWLELDDARSALQQRHRDIAELDYDRAELEDWSLSLSCEDLRDRQSSFAEITTPGQISLSTLPSIREDDALELEEDVGDCLWNDCGFATIEIDECRIGDDVETSEKRWECSRTHSPGGSWSSASDAHDKRSSVALSEDGDCANVGLDFTRDFYRLVKYESTKSLASNSSRGLPTADGNSHLRFHDVQAMALQDREQALQNVLNFIAEQQKYCRDREESDSVPSRPVSEIRELPPPYAAADFDDESVCPRSEVSEDRLRPDSFGSFSENDSCDVLPDRPRIQFCDTVSEPRSTPRFIEREDPYAESEDYYDEFARTENDENELDEHHRLKVKRNNEINRTNQAKVTDSETLDKVDEPCDVEPSRNPDDSFKEAAVKILLKQGGHELPLAVEGCLIKSSSFPFANGEAESLVEEVLSACRRSTGALVPVPEEEESSSPESGSPQMTESNTTSTSTAETVIVSNKEPKGKEKSRIPMLMGRRPPASPGRVRSRIPVAERARPSAAPAPLEPIIVKQEHTLSFHEAATSKDVIEELNRMIRQSEGASEAKEERTQGQKDGALWAPTGWVHVEKDIDFSDPKARANLLDVMLASSDSSPSSCGSCPSPAPAEPPPPPYSRLHRLHRSRRQKTAAALRSRGLGVLRWPRARRPSILGRDGFFVRYGDGERAAVASFDFLDHLSAPEAKDC